MNPERLMQVLLAPIVSGIAQRKHKDIGFAMKGGG